MLTYTPTITYMHIGVHMHVKTSHTYIHTYVHISKRACIHTHPHAYTYMHVLYRYTIHACIYTHIYSNKKRSKKAAENQYPGRVTIKGNRQQRGLMNLKDHPEIIMRSLVILNR